MEVSWSSILEVVGFTDDVTDVQGIAVVEEELRNRGARNGKGTLGQVYIHMVYNHKNIICTYIRTYVCML